MTVDLTPLINAAVYLVPISGAGLLVFALWPVSGLRKGSFAGGVFLLAGGSVLSAVSLVPVPRNPTPDSPFTPAPVTGDFPQAVRAAFDGTRAEGQQLAALFSQMADSLEFDGRREKPVIKNTTDLGRLFAELQRYRGLSESPWGERFPALKRTVADEMARRGIMESGKTLPLDASRRTEAARLFRDVAVGLGEGR